ncbi:methyltransferase MT-A70 family protein isoform X2 [Tasmannia lanceolata]|uniref:methyltransferase MT-A70 family protein isoform X2 n=1 Tax=Tasmannia lanceolata TaxID=3420 RepID=UPI0040643909
MTEEVFDEELSSFMDCGIYRLKNSNAVFMDPVRVLNHSYTRFRVSPSRYYSRFTKESVGKLEVSVDSRKRKRNKRPSYVLNEREKFAEKRHQEARPLLLRAHEAFMGATDLLSFICSLKGDRCPSTGNKDITNIVQDMEPSFVELGRIWQAPLYEISLFSHSQNKLEKDEGMPLGQHSEGTVVPIFNNLVTNETNDDMDAEFLNNWYILPMKSSFHMSDLGQIQDLIPAQAHNGFNLIVIDPPWENGSAHQKSLYPTMPNRYFLSIPVNQLAHTEGALVALWVTNREKLRLFVEKELFPAWGVTDATVFYWLKVKADGSLIGELDLFHHRPYECLILGYSNGKGIDYDHQPAFTPLQDNQVIISIPGDHSRKPPIGKLLSDYIPGPRPARCIELFARELTAGWTSWGNEPLRFQESRYFTNEAMEG